MKNTGINKKYTMIMFAAAIIALVVFALLGKKEQQKPILSEIPTSTPPLSSVTPVLPEGPHGMHMGKNELYVADQKEGSSVTVSTVSFAEPGYVVIFKREPDGISEKVIGVSKLLSQTNKNIVISLTEPIKTGDKLRATSYADMGEGRFVSLLKNTPIGDNVNSMLSVELTVFPSSAFLTGTPY